MTITRFILIPFILLLTSAPAYSIDAAAIIRQVEDNLNGKTLFMKLTMIVKTKRTERKMKMDSYSIGKDKSFIKITYPGKDKGITFLKTDNSMWQYVPRIEKVIKIPASINSSRSLPVKLPVILFPLFLTTGSSDKRGLIKL